MSWAFPSSRRGSWRSFFEPIGFFGGQRLNHMSFGHQRFIPLFFVFSFGTSLGIAATEFKDAEITTLKNIVEHDAGQGAAPAKVNEKIGENSKVTTAAASMAELTFGDSSITRIGANSVFSFQSKERLVKLDKGTALIHATPGNGGATVDCGGVTAAVSGSTFLASRSATGGAVFVLLESSGSLKVTTPGGQTAVIMSGQAASTGTGAKSGIQVFDVDVKKVMDTTPLVQGFKKELPSQAEINVVSEKQQAMIREGKIEVLGVEVVATGQDGDLLVGAPRERPEPGAGGDGLDINTAAGGEGPGAVAGTKPPPPPGVGPSNGAARQGPILDTSFLAAQRKLAETGPQGPTQLNVTLPEGILEGTLQAGTVSLNSPAVQAVPVTLVSASGRNITFNFPQGSTIPVGATSIPFTFTVADDGYISNGGAVSAPISIRAFASKLSTVGGGLVADITSGIDPVGTASGTLQPGSAENPFTVRLPGKVAADLDAKVTLETFRNGMKIGMVEKDAVIRAGESVLNLTGNSLPEPKIYSSEAINMRLTVALAQIGKTISQDIQILPRSLDNAVIRAANPIRNLLTSVNTALSWSSDSDAMAYEITTTSLGETKTKLVLDHVYNWMDGLASNAKVEVKALTSGIQEGALTLTQDSKFKLLFGEQGKISDIRKSSVEIFLAVLGSGGELVDSILLKDNGAGAFWVTDAAGKAKQVASIDYDVGIVSLSEDALGAGLPIAEVFYSTSFVEEKNLTSIAKVDTSAGLNESELIQADKYFYFESKFGAEGPTKFFANAPLELDLAKMNDWSAPASWLDQESLAAVDFDFYAANARIYLNDSSNKRSQPDQIVFNSDKVVLYADKISLLGEFEKLDGTTTVLDVSLQDSNEKALTLIGGKNGIDVRNVVLDVNGADLTMETSSGVSMDTAFVKNIGNKFEVSAASAVEMGAEGGTSEVTVQAKSETANSMAVIRTGDSLELRRVVLKSFARGEIVNVSAENKGRVLLSGSTARDFHINELVNAVIVADAKGQADPLRSSSPDIVAQGGDLTVEGNLPIKTAKYQGVDVHGYNVNLEASRIALSGARITAINAITAKAQTLVVDNSILRVVNALGSINLYSGSGFVNQQYGTVAEGMVNFSGSNSFKIGDQTVSISSAQDVQNALNSGLMIQGAASPVSGKINILPVNNVSRPATSQLN
jgi:FecR protein